MDNTKNCNKIIWLMKFQTYDNGSKIYWNINSLLTEIDIF